MWENEFIPPATLSHCVLQSRTTCRFSSAGGRRACKGRGICGGYFTSCVSIAFHFSNCQQKYAILSECAKISAFFMILTKTDVFYYILYKNYVTPERTISLLMC